MCLYPKLIFNPKYKPNKKNKGKPPTPTDPRVLWVPIGCNQCIECRKQKSRAWQVRLQEHIRTDHTGKFITLTFSNESIKILNKEIPTEIEGYDRDNAIATLATRRFLERWRKKNKKSVTHWLITELGHKGTENIHIHGLIFTNQPTEIDKHWQYGYIYHGEWVNDITINYIIKYVHKMDHDHPNYTPKILTSSGIGSNYIQRHDAKQNQYKNNGKTKETYTTRQGTKLNLPIYYRNKIYTEQQREQLWLEKLDKQIRWVCGEKFQIKNGDHTGFDKLVEHYRIINKQMGYGDGTIDYQQKAYENTRRKLNQEKRLNGTNNMEAETAGGVDTPTP